MYVIGVDLLFRLEFVNLLYVNCQTACCVEATRTHIALEVLGLLVLH